MINDYANLPKVSDFDSLINQLYKTNHSTYDSRLMSSPSCHFYHLDTCPLDYNEELYLPDYNTDDDYE